MTGDDIKRLNYYERQYLGARDFRDEQAYHTDMRRRHAIAHHSWGIVAGLELQQIAKEGSPDEKEVFVKPGMAVDGFGREIIILTAQKIDPSLFEGFGDDTHYEVWIAHDERNVDPPANGYGSCDVENQYARVVESFKIHIGPQNPLHDPIEVDGTSVTPPTIPWDESVPYQELPDVSTNSEWLVRLGSVRWNGTKLIETTAERLKEHRRYIGSIASEIGTPAGTLLIRDRALPSPLPAVSKGVAVKVEGSLDVERKLNANRDAEVKNNLIVDGKLGVGTTTPEAKAQFMGGTDATLGAKSSGFLVAGDPNGKNVAIDTNSIIARNNGTKSPLELQSQGGDVVFNSKNPDDAKKVVVKDGTNVGVGTLDPQARVHIATGTDITLDNGTGYLVLGEVNGENLAIDKNEIMARDNGKSSTLHFQAEGGDMLLHYYKSGTEFMVKNNGNVGVGTPNPAQRLDVHGRIVRHGDDFSRAGVLPSGAFVVTPWGTNNDWNIFVSPHTVGLREGFSEGDNALLEFKCYAEVVSANMWQVWVRYVFRVNDAPLPATEYGGLVNYILIPK